VVIHLDLKLPSGSSGQPEPVGAGTLRFYLTLLRMGFTFAPAVTCWTVSPYLTISPFPTYVLVGGMISVALSSPYGLLLLGAIFPAGVRTFLSP